MFLLDLLMKEMRKLWTVLKCIFVSPVPMSRRSKELWDLGCLISSYVTVCHIFVHFDVAVKKPRLFVLLTLLYFTCGTVKISWFLPKTCVHSWVKICSRVYFLSIFFFFFFSCKLFVWKLLKLSLLLNPYQLAKAFPKSYDCIICLFANEFCQSITKVPPTYKKQKDQPSQLVMINSFNQRTYYFHKAKFHSNMKTIIIL